MRRIRVIPVLTIDQGKLVKTVKFNNPNYIGDPINAIKIFNAKEVDEIVVLDISATKLNKEPNFKLIEELAGECFMPLAYGGGIRNIYQAKKLFDLGVEKVILNSIVESNVDLINEIASKYGNQSVVISLDIKSSFFSGQGHYHNSGRRKSKLSIEEYLKLVIAKGAGEIMINHIDNEGTFNGYDIELINKICTSVNVPVVACGGTNSVDNMAAAIFSGKASAVAAGSLFVYMGNNPNSILVNYPSQEVLTTKIFSNLR